MPLTPPHRASQQSSARLRRTQSESALGTARSPDTLPQSPLALRRQQQQPTQSPAAAPVGAETPAAPAAPAAMLSRFANSGVPKLLSGAGIAGLGVLAFYQRGPLSLAEPAEGEQEAFSASLVKGLAIAGTAFYGLNRMVDGALQMQRELHPPPHPHED